MNTYAYVEAVRHLENLQGKRSEKDFDANIRFIQVIAMLAIAESLTNIAMAIGEKK